MTCAGEDEQMESEDTATRSQDDLPNLGEENRRFLKTVAREAVERHVRGQELERPLYDDPRLKKEWGAFVTLKIGGLLRGCIGNIVSDQPLPETIAELAVKSASSDPRFPPIGPAELESLDIDISVMGPLQEVKDIGEIVIGRDGLVIEKGLNRGLLLPQVASEHGFDVPTFLSQTCLKAGLPLDAWKKGARIYRFPAEVF